MEVEVRELADECGATYVDTWTFIGDGDVHAGYQLWLNDNEPSEFVKQATELVMSEVDAGEYELVIAIRQAAESADFGRPSARKTGRDARWPYLPIIVTEASPSDPTTRTKVITGLAFASREEAVWAAERHIRIARNNLFAQLNNPGCRALREQHGLPRELPAR